MVPDLEWLKSFLKQDTMAAVSAIMMFVIVVQWRKMNKLQEARLQDLKDRMEEAKSLTLLTDKLVTIIMKGRRKVQPSDSSYTEQAGKDSSKE